MLLATLPERYARYMGADWSSKNEVAPDGQAKYVPNGLRVVEALLLERFAPDDIAVCYTDQLSRFVGPNTRVVAIHAHNPLGITFATDVYAGLYGSACAPINAVEFQRLIEHPVLRLHKPHCKLIVGGPGSWQIEHKNLQDKWQIDCIVHGEAEDLVLPLFEAAVRGDEIPRRLEGQSPSLESIPTMRHRCTFGVVEITRGCGRGCQFCSVALRGGKSIPLPQILENVRVQVAEGADHIMLTTEDLFLYEQGLKFQTNVPALKRLFHSVAAVPGVKYVSLTHGTISPVVVDPEAIEELSEVQRYAMMFVGLETGLFKQYMKGKCYSLRFRWRHLSSDCPVRRPLIRGNRSTCFTLCATPNGA
jgi:radical SAM superfamily enzyme YgiQ (UPF0313 family)